MSETKKNLTDSERSEKLQALLNDKTFAEGLAGKKEPEDAQKYFAENGLELSHEDIMGLGKMLNQLSAKNGELSEDELADVAGGSWWGVVLGGLGCGVGLPAAILGGVLTGLLTW